MGRQNTNNKSLIIGLDFGAAFTKVIIGDNRVRYAVPFNVSAGSENQYLLPSTLHINKNNSCQLVPAERLSSDSLALKLPLLDNTQTTDDLLRITTFLALVFRESKDWLLSRYVKRYSRCQIDWSINVGLPELQAKNDKQAKLYEELIRTAWIVSVLPGPITLGRVAQCHRTSDDTFNAFPAVYQLELAAKRRIKVIPSFVAQIYGCARSHIENKGLHLLMDIGGATLTITSFECGDDFKTPKCMLYTASTKLIGVDYLLKRRYENLQLADNEINIFSDIPSNYVFSQSHELTEKDIKFADTLYSGEVSKQISKVLNDTKAKHSPHSECWESGVPTVICGGGSHLEIIENIQHRFENKTAPYKINVVGYAVPNDLMVEALPENTFDRLSVAYGLSHSAETIMKAFAEDADTISQNIEFKTIT